MNLAKCVAGCVPGCYQAKFCPLLLGWQKVRRCYLVEFILYDSLNILLRTVSRRLVARIWKEEYIALVNQIMKNLSPYSVGRRNSKRETLTLSLSDSWMIESISIMWFNSPIDLFGQMLLRDGLLTVAWIKYCQTVIKITTYSSASVETVVCTCSATVYSPIFKCYRFQSIEVHTPNIKMSMRYRSNYANIEHNNNIHNNAHEFLTKVAGDLNERNCSDRLRILLVMYLRARKVNQRPISAASSRTGNWCTPKWPVFFCLFWFVVNVFTSIFHLFCLSK